MWSGATYMIMLFLSLPVVLSRLPSAALSPLHRLSLLSCDASACDSGFTLSMSEVRGMLAGLCASTSSAPGLSVAARFPKLRTALERRLVAFLNAACPLAARLFLNSVVAYSLLMLKSVRLESSLSLSALSFLLVKSSILLLRVSPSFKQKFCRMSRSSSVNLTTLPYLRALVLVLCCIVYFSAGRCHSGSLLTGQSCS